MAPAGSFRDPGGRCVVSKNRVFRSVTSVHLPDFERFLQSSVGGELLSEGRLIRTVKLSEREVGQLSSEGLLPPDFSQPLEDSEKTGAVFEHESVWFPSYPYEWIPEMLHAAGDLTLTVAQKALGGGFGIKDATPFNVLFRGIEPVFVDLLSFEVRNDEDPIWKPYAQFVRTFLLPLLAHRLWGVPLSDAFVTRHGKI